MPLCHRVFRWRRRARLPSRRERACCDAAQARRRDRGRNRGLAGGRAERHRAQGRRRDHRLQPRQGHRRHRLRRPAARPREHRGLLAPRRSSDTVAKALDDRALHGRGRLRRARRSRRCSRAAWPDLDLYHPWDLSVDEAIALGPRMRGARRSRSIRGSRTPKARRSRCTKSRIRLRQQQRLLRRLSRARAIGIDCSVIGEEDGAMQRDDWYTSARAPDDLESAARGRPHRRRAHRAPPRRAQARDARVPGAVRGARSPPA